MSSPFMQRLATLCERLPGAEAYVMHSHPAYRAGKKCFAIVGNASDDKPDATPHSISIKVALMDQSHYCEDPRFSITHYIGQHGWITLDLSGGHRWEEVEGLVLQSYRRAATKRMLTALDAAPV